MDSSEVIIKNGVTSIWGTAFGNCVNLQEVELPISLDSLYNAFEGCTSLNKINLPKNLSYIGYNTFKNNKSLTSIIISNHLRHLDLSAFSGCEQLQTLEFNFGVHEISGSLSDCSNLKAIFFRGDFRYISDWGLTFYDCPKLEGVFVPKEYYELFLSKTPVKFQKYIQIEN